MLRSWISGKTKGAVQPTGEFIQIRASVTAVYKVVCCLVCFFSGKEGCYLGSDSAAPRSLASEYSSQ